MNKITKKDIEFLEHLKSLNHGEVAKYCKLNLKLAKAMQELQEGKKQ